MTSALDRLIAEARAPQGALPFPFGGGTVLVPPLWEWPDTAVDALADDDYEAWADLVLNDQSLNFWDTVDPTVGQCDDLLTAYEAATGVDLDEVAELSDLLHRFPTQIESDLRRYCAGLDLRHLWQPDGGPSQLTWRLLGALLDGLPGESLLHTAIRDQYPADQLAKARRAGHGTWSHTDFLLAAAVDRLGWLHAAVYRSQGGKAEYPDPWPRPGVTTAAERRRLTPQGLAYLLKLRDDHIAAHGP